MDNRERVRIVDIAEELGVSTATVSNVIHGKTKKISEETVRRVEALLEEREYIPSMAGVLLARNDSGIVGVVINNHEKYEGGALQDPFIAAALNALSVEIENRQLFMMVKTTTDYQDIIKFATMWNLVGLVVIGFCEQDYDNLRTKMRIPFVVYDGMFHKTSHRICNISIDDYDGGFQVGKYFAETGHTSVLCLSDNEESMDLRRYQGFCDALAKKNIIPKFLLVPKTKDKRKQFYCESLEVFEHCTAVFAVSDYYAVEVMQFLQKCGKNIPEDISIAGFDDIPICTMVRPALTTVRQNQEMRAKNAIEMLLDLKNKKQTVAELKLPVELVVRDSTR